MHKPLLTITLAAAFATFSANGFAIPSLRISDGFTTITIADGDAQDVNPAAGAVSWIGSIGVWDVNSITGVTKPVLGYNDLPTMNLGFLDTSTGAGTLTLMFTETGFTNPFASWVGMRLGGTTTGTVRYDLYGVASNDPFDTTRLLGSIGPLGGAFSGSGTNRYLGGRLTPYSLTQVITINHNGEGSTSGSAFARIPDGGITLFLFCGGLFGLKLLSRIRLVSSARVK